MRHLTVREESEEDGQRSSNRASLSQSTLLRNIILEEALGTIVGEALAKLYYGDDVRGFGQVLPNTA
jgi:hypothetical protein